MNGRDAVVPWWSGVAIPEGPQISVALTAMILTGVLGSLYLRHARRGTRIAAIPLADPIGLSLASGHARKASSLLIAILWLALSALVIFVTPWGRSVYLLDPVQTIAAANFGVAVPLLVGCYVAMLRSYDRFLALIPETSETLRPARQGRGFWIIQIGIVIAALAIQWAAIRSEINLPSPCSPWVEVADAWSGEGGAQKCSERRAESEATKQPAPKGTAAPKTPGASADEEAPAESNIVSARPGLTGAGIVNYALRGLNAALAIGLFASLTTIASMLSRSRIARAQVTCDDFPGLRPNDKTLDLGTTLVGAMLLSSIVATLTGVALAAHGSRFGDFDKARLLTESTWIIWVVLTFIGSLLAANTVRNLHCRIADEVRERHRRAQDELGEDPPPLAQDADIEARGARLAHLAALAKARGDLMEHCRTAKTWPLPTGSLPAIGFATLAQLGNVLFALYTFGRS